MSEPIYGPYHIMWGIKAGKESAKLLFKALRKSRERPEVLLPYIDADSAFALLPSMLEMQIIDNLRFIKGESEYPNAYVDFIKAFALSKKKTLHLEIPEWEPVVMKG